MNELTQLLCLFGLAYKICFSEASMFPNSQNLEKLCPYIRVVFPLDLWTNYSENIRLWLLTILVPNFPFSPLPNSSAYWGLSLLHSLSSFFNWAHFSEYKCATKVESVVVIVIDSELRRSEAAAAAMWEEAGEGRRENIWINYRASKRTIERTVLDISCQVQWLSKTDKNSHINYQGQLKREYSNF